MSENSVGGIIKAIAAGMAILGGLAIVIASIVMALDQEEFLIVLGGLFAALAWAASWVVLYGFGQLIDNTFDIMYRIEQCRQELHGVRGNTEGQAAPAVVRTPNKIFRGNPSEGRTNASAPAGSWTCTCGKVHPNYVSSCVCGVSKRDAMRKE